VTPSFLPLLFQCLATPQVNIRLASAELLFELVAKGMSPTDKLELLRILNVSDIVSQLLTRDDERKKSGVENEQDELYREKLGRVLNVLGLEFTRIVDEVRMLPLDFKHKAILITLWIGERNRRTERGRQIGCIEPSSARYSLP
jgi:hypothetical protein